MTTTITLTDTGEAMLAYLLKGDTSTKGYVTHMAVGTGAAGGETATALTTELSRKALTSATVSTGAGANANKVVFVADWSTSEGNDTLTEVGLFTAASSGNMFAIASISPGIGKTSDYNLQLSWTVPFE